MTEETADAPQAAKGTEAKTVFITWIVEEAEIVVTRTTAEAGNTVDIMSAASGMANATTEAAVKPVAASTVTSPVDIRNAMIAVQGADFATRTHHN